MNFTLLVIMIALVAFINGGLISFFFLYRFYKRNANKLVDRHREDMSLYVDCNNRVKILEGRIHKIIKAFRNTKSQKQDILKCLQK